MESVPVIQNQPTSPGAADTAWTTGTAWHHPVVSPTLGTNEHPETPHPVTFPGDADPGGRDIVSATVMGAVASAEARYGELASDTYGQGSHIGDVPQLPDLPDRSRTTTHQADWAG
jgi:hypothetical protein